jgi:hypothetical protein
MKSPWLWIIGLFVAVWFFSGRKDDSRSARAEYIPPQPVYQLPTTPTYSASSFMGYPCTIDCSGHEAGYNWAEQHGIDDPDDCTGNSSSFIEGCQAYAEEQQEDSDN